MLIHVTFHCIVVIFKTCSFLVSLGASNWDVGVTQVSVSVQCNWGNDWWWYKYTCLHTSIECKCKCCKVVLLVCFPYLKLWSHSDWSVISSDWVSLLSHFHADLLLLFVSREKFSRGRHTRLSQGALTRPLPAHWWRYGLFCCCPLYSSQRPRCQGESSPPPTFTLNALLLAPEFLLKMRFVYSLPGANCDWWARPSIHETSSF